LNNKKRISGFKNNNNKKELLKKCKHMSSGTTEDEG
jgi:hypothetical protein